MDTKDKDENYVVHVSKPLKHKNGYRTCPFIKRK